MTMLRVLVVDDDPLIGNMLVEVLEGMGHAVCALATTERDAVTAAIQCSPDLMVVDVRLRDGSGVAAVEKILRSGPVPHIFLSGDISQIKAHRPGAVAIQKPFRICDLASAIQLALGEAAGPEHHGDQR